MTNPDARAALFKTVQKALFPSVGGTAVDANSLATIASHEAAWERKMAIMENWSTEYLEEFATRAANPPFSIVNLIGEESLRTWFKSPSITCKEAAFLALGIEPGIKVKYLRLETEEILRQMEFELYPTVRCALDGTTIHIEKPDTQISLAAAITLFKTKGRAVAPKVLQVFDEHKAATNADLKKKNLTSQMPSTATADTLDQELAGPSLKKFKSLQKVALALAMRGLPRKEQIDPNFDPYDPNRNRNGDNLETIASCIRAIGLSLHKDTIRELIKQAYEANKTEVDQTLK